jgi:hypothetical protein
MKLNELIRDLQFRGGRYEVEGVLGSHVHRLLDLSFESDDDLQGRRLPKVKVASDLPTHIRGIVANALVRAGASHPGLEAEDVAKLHSAARQNGHIELFIDINSLTQGLAAQLGKSLGYRLSRIVVSSSSIDVLHEYQSNSRRHHDGGPPVIEAWELARGMRSLREFKTSVHVHQLAPGAARYFRRGRADASSTQKNAASHEEREEATYIAEDRQMIAAFWDYLSTNGPRIPIFLVTSDLALAHVCSAERVPFIFARAPREYPQALEPETLWFDPYSLSFRTCLAQTILWELSLVLGNINVRPVGSSGQPFSIRYSPRTHLPGQAESVDFGVVAKPTPTASAPSIASSTEVAGSSPRARAASDRALVKLSLVSIVGVLPTAPGQRQPFTQFAPKDIDSIRQLWQIGETTQLFSEDNGYVIAGPSLPELLKALESSDYIGVNGIFRRVPGYARVLDDAAATGVFPSSKAAGAATGWAITLGAAFKMPGITRFGLREVSDEQFESAVARSHSELSVGERAVALARVLERVCVELQLSPIRFEALLSRSLGQRGLRDFEAQRARSKANLPSHPVLVLPSTSAPSSYLRKLSPGEGIVIGGKLVGSLVRRGRS